MSDLNRQYAERYIKQALTSSELDAPDHSQANSEKELLDALYDAHRKGGPDAVKRAWEAALRNEPSYAKLVVERKLYHITELGFLPRLTYLVESEIPEKGLVALYGASGSGKTFTSLNYALLIAQNKPVVYIAGEGLSGYTKRIDAWLEHHNIDRDKLDFYLFSEPVNLLDADELRKFIEDVREKSPALIVVDTLARCMVGGDENSSRDMGQFINGCDRIKNELNATVLIVHHTGKRGASERGSSALRGACDIMIELKNSTGVIELTCTKAKDGTEFPTRYLKLQTVCVDEDTSSCVLVPSARINSTSGDELKKNEWRALEVLGEEIFLEAGVKRLDVQKSLELADSTIHRILGELKKKGHVSQSKKGDPFKITQQGKDLLARRDNEIEQLAEAPNNDTSQAE